MIHSPNLRNIISQIDETRVEELRLALDEYYPQDIAEEYKKLTQNERQLLFDILSYQQGAQVFIELEQREIEELFDYLSDKKIIKFTNELDLDDAADIIGLLDDERMLRILDKIQRPFEIKELLAFEPDSCGGIMNPDFISVRADLKVSAALRFIRLKARENDSQIIYIYVTQKFGELAGVVSLKNLFLANEDSSVSDHMNTDVILVNTNEDREVAAELISKYHFLAIPVVNTSKQLVGTISIEDVVEILEDEVTQDIYQSSGINIEPDSVSAYTDIRKYFTAYKARTPWLVITLLGQILSASLIVKFSNVISALPIAVSFMPLLSGLSGNIGNQSTTIIVRGISTGEIDTDRSSEIVSYELLISLSIGLTCALITSGISFLMNGNLLLCGLIALSLLISMFSAVFLGSLTPIIFKKIDIDPASASGPLITTMIDIISFIVYLSLINTFIGKLI
ncbi:MAG: magnesium transporter [Candidatus Caenarcaniphilales bacterium]|nr:magnesium transporter [Candidatus Caenarcaniphilales bacterium]